LKPATARVSIPCAVQSRALSRGLERAGLRCSDCLAACPRDWRGGEGGADAECGDREVQRAVGGVDGDQPKDVVAVDEAPDRDQQVDRAEAEREQSGGVHVASEGDAGEAGGDVDEVVPSR
jgi:hypothetical protein